MKKNITYTRPYLLALIAAIAAAVLLGSDATAVADDARSEDISRRISEQQQELANTRRQLDELDKKILEKENALEQNRLDLADASTMLREAEDRYDEYLRRFNERISTIYKLGEGKFYAVLLSSEDFSEALIRISYLATISENDLRLIERVRTEESEMRALRERVDNLKQNQAEDVNELRKQQLGMERQIATGQKQVDADMDQLIKTRAREQEEEARRMAEQGDSQSADLGLLFGGVIGPSILAGTGPPPGLQPSGMVLRGTASWYGPGFHGNRTANGEVYDMYAMTAAHKTLPFGTWLKVTNNGRSVFVRINDRGPYIAGRFLDLSAGSAQAIGLTGVGSVTAEIYR